MWPGPRAWGGLQPPPGHQRRPGPRAARKRSPRALGGAAPEGRPENGGRDAWGYRTSEAR
eukprot:2888149-Lingulodinium_polyedra.AAC.1